MKSHLVEHGFYVAEDGHLVFTKPKEHCKQGKDLEWVLGRGGCSSSFPYTGMSS